MADEPNITIRQSGKVKRPVEYDPAWAWRCEECGWTGIELSSQDAAIREAGKHWNEKHAATLGANPLLALKTSAS